MGRLPKFLLLSTLLVLASGPAFAEQVEVELITIGPGDALYAAFGHTALLTVHDGRPRWVYNFGYANFDQPDFVLRFLRGQAMFFVARETWRDMKQDCRDEDRYLWRQALALSSEQHRALDAKLREAIRPENKRYRYHHYTNNCATRPRDLLDEVLGGAVRRELRARPADGPIRSVTHHGFAGRAAVLYFMDYILGRPGDRPITLWEEAFLPGSLSWSLQRYRLAGAPLEVVPREGPSFDGRDPDLGLKLQRAAAAAAVALGLALALLLRRRSRWAALPLAALCLHTAALGALALGLVVVSDAPELRSNELIFSYWVADLALLGVAYRWLRGRMWAGGALRLYALARVVAVAWVAVGHLSGALVQRPLELLAFPAALALGLWWGVRRLGRRMPECQSAGMPERRNA